MLLQRMCENHVGYMITKQEMDSYDRFKVFNTKLLSSIYTPGKLLSSFNHHKSMGKPRHGLQAILYHSAVQSTIKESRQTKDTKFS